MLVLVALHAGAERAGAQSSAGQTPEALVKQLADPSYAKRQQAWSALIADNRMSLDEVAIHYSSASGPEQRQRLLDVAQHHLVRGIQEKLSVGGGAACLGVSLPAAAVSVVELDEFNPGARMQIKSVRVSRPTGAAAKRSMPGVFVGRVYPGFPAFGRLQTGDYITHVQGKDLTAEEEPQARELFITTVQNQPAGSEVRVRVTRDGEAIEMTLRTAALPALTEVYQPDGDATLRPNVASQWQALLARLRASGPASPPLQVKFDDAPRPVITH